MLRSTLFAALALLSAGLHGFTNGQAADLVLGQPNFSTNGANQGGISAASDYGAEKIWTNGTVFLVAEALNHRVRVYSSVPSADAQAADLILGQPTTSSNTGATSAAGLRNPLSACFDGTHLIVADSGNHRVLIWNSFPSSTGQAADLVLGQSNFTSGSANRGGATAGDGFNIPHDVWSDGTRLIVADEGNNRVLVWNSFPSVNGQAASLAVGQPSLTSNTAALSASGLYGPQGLTVHGGKLLVADTNSDRVVIFNSVPSANGASADLVIGQSSLSASGAGNGAAQMDDPKDLAVSAAGVLAVADHNNHRVLLYNAIPTADGASADNVLGQSAFNTGASNAGGSVSAVGIDRASGAAWNGADLWAADHWNNRVLRYSGPTPTPTPTSVPSPCASVPNIPACNWNGVGQPGDLLVSIKSGTTGRILRLDRGTGVYSLFASSAYPMLDGLVGIPGTQGEFLAVDQAGHLERFDASGASLGIWGTAPVTGTGLKIASFNPIDGSLWVPNQDPSEMWRFPAGGGTGVRMTFTAGAFYHPTGTAFDENGDLYVANASFQNIIKVSNADLGLASIPYTVLASGFTLNVLGLAYDGNGGLYTSGWWANAPYNTSSLWRVDTSSGAKVQLNANFSPLTENAGGALYQSDGVTIDSDGNLWTIQFQNPGFVTKGLLKQSPAGVPLAFYPIPNVVDSATIGTDGPDQIYVLGSAGVRPACGVPVTTPCASATPTASPSPTASPTPSPSATLTATPTSAPLTASPSATPTATRTATAVPFTATSSPTVTITPAPPTALPTATSSPTPSVPAATAVPTRVRRDDHRVECHPNYVRGRGGVMKILVRAYAGGSCGIKVNRANGRTLAELWHGYLQPQEQRTQEWNCTDSQGEESPSGVYYVVFTDGDGSIQVQKVLIVR